MTKEIPINISDAYFSKNIILNDIAVNSNWNLVYNILHASNIRYNPYIKHSEEEASDSSEADGRVRGGRLAGSATWDIAVVRSVWRRTFVGVCV